MSAYVCVGLGVGVCVSVCVRVCVYVDVYDGGECGCLHEW